MMKNYLVFIRGRAFLKMLLWGGILLSAWFEGQAQVPAVAANPMPEGPLIVPAPEFSSWTVSYSYPWDRGEKKTARPPDPSAVRKVIVTKTRNVMHEKTLSVSGASYEKWQVGRRFYMRVPGPGYWGAYDETYIKNNPSPDSKYAFIPVSGFRGVAWVGEETYVGELRQGKKMYLVFVPKGVKQMDLSDMAGLHALPTFALIDAATRLPAWVKGDGVIAAYTFLVPPAKVQALPGDLDKQIKEVELRQAKLFGAPNKEY